jgi:hypothetical protein
MSLPNFPKNTKFQKRKPKIQPKPIVALMDSEAALVFVKSELLQVATLQHMCKNKFGKSMFIWNPIKKGTRICLFDEFGNGLIYWTYTGDLKALKKQILETVMETDDLGQPKYKLDVTHFVKIWHEDIGQVWELVKQRKQFDLFYTFVVGGIRQIVNI